MKPTPLYHKEIQEAKEFKPKPLEVSSEQENKYLSEVRGDLVKAKILSLIDEIKAELENNSFV